MFSFDRTKINDFFKITSYVDSRSTTVHLMTSVFGGASLSSEHKRLIRISAAFFPISSLCWLTVVGLVENLNQSVKTNYCYLFWNLYIRLTKNTQVAAA